MATTPYEPRHRLPDDVAAELRAALLRRGLGLRQAALKIGITHGYLTLLEQGERCPSIVVARELVAVLGLKPGLATELLDGAQVGVGHRSRYNLKQSAGDRDAREREARDREALWRAVLW